MPICVSFYLWYLWVSMCGLWCPHLSLSCCPFSCMCTPHPDLTLQEIWMAIGGTMHHGIATRPPHCLWWDMWSPSQPLPLPPFFLPLNPPPPDLFLSPQTLVSLCLLSFHVSFVLFTLLHVVFSVFSFCFYPTPVGESQRGKRKTIEQAFMSEPTHTLSERQKKMVRFGGHSFEEDLAWCEPQVKDSGVDTCSSTTLNEEHSHSEKVLRQSSLHFVIIIILWPTH